MFVACPPSVDICLSVCFTLDCVQFSKTDCASVRFNVDNGNKTSPWLAHIRLAYPLPKFWIGMVSNADCFIRAGRSPWRGKQSSWCPDARRLSGGVNWRIGKGRTADHAIFHTKHLQKNIPNHVLMVRDKKNFYLIFLFYFEGTIRKQNLIPLLLILLVLPVFLLPT